MNNVMHISKRNVYSCIAKYSLMTAVIIFMVLSRSSHVFGAIALEGSWTTVGSSTVIDSVGGITTSGSDRILVVMISTENAGTMNINTMNLGNASENIAMKRVELANQTNARCELWFATDAQLSSFSADSIYFTWTGIASSYECIIGWATYSGVDQMVELAQDSITAVRTSTTPDPLTATINVSVDEIVFGVFVEGNSSTTTWNNGFTKLYDVTQAGTVSGTGAYKIMTSGGTQQLSADFDGITKRACILGATFAAAGGGGGSPISYRRRKLLIGDIK